MSRRGRLGLFLVAGTLFSLVLLIGLGGLPSFGDYHGIYGKVVSSTEPALRRATDLVTALNFDIRAFDTLGEEFILFTSVAGVALLLRRLRLDDDNLDLRRGEEDHSFAGASPALRLVGLILIPLLVALGCYIVAHGQLTPGGGFQGGIVLAAAPLVVLLTGRYVALKRLAPDWALESVESLGAAGYTLLGLGGLVFAAVFMKNFLPLGTSGKLLSAGTMPLASLAVGLEVTGAFLLTWTEFLDQALLVRREEDER